MESLTSQVKQLQQRNQDLSTLENRLNQLKQQLKLQESSNHIIEQKMTKILTAKQMAQMDQFELNQRRQQLDSLDGGQHNKIKLIRKIQAEENRKLKQDVQEEKILKSALLKQQLELVQYQNLKRKEEELQEKQLQYQKIAEWEFNLKQDLENRRLEKIEKIRSTQVELKNQLAGRLQEQSLQYQKLIQEENTLLNKLKSSQSQGNNLKNHLADAMNVSIRGYVNNTTNLSQAKSYSVSKLMQKHLDSPYAQIPTILKLKASKESLLKKYQNSLPTLQKPSYNEQQEQVNRLFASTVQKKTKDLSMLLKPQDRYLMSKSDGVVYSEQNLTIKSKESIARVQQKSEIKKEQQPVKPKEQNNPIVKSEIKETNNEATKVVESKDMKESQKKVEDEYKADEDEYQAEETEQQQENQQQQQQQDKEQEEDNEEDKYKEEENNDEEYPQDQEEQE